MPEWLLGVVVGFVLAIVWDIYKFGRETRQRDEAVMMVMMLPSVKTNFRQN
jgi:hypothetical protein